MQHTTRFLTAAALALITGSALAVQPQTENAPLRGPKVQDAGKPDRSAQPADEMVAQKKIEMPFMAYVAALRTLQRGEDESLRLTPEQAEQVRTINQEHRAANEKYMEEHREELAKLRAASGERAPMDPDARPAQRRQGQGQGEGQGQDGAERPAARPQERPARNQEGGADRPQRNRDGMQPENADAPRPSPEERAKAAERMREIMLNAPGDAESKKKLMNVLTKPQIERIEVAIEAQRQRIREGRPPIADQPQRPAGQEGRRPANPDAQRPGQTGERPARRPARNGGDD